MKKISFVAFFLLFLGALSFGQSAWVDSASVNDSELYTKVITFEGRIDGTGSLTSEAFTLDDVGSIITTYWDQSQANDSVKTTGSLLVSGNGSSTITAITIWSSDTTETYKGVIDTLNYSALTCYLKITGVAGNGYNNTVSVELVGTKRIE